jgi:3-oxoacyl-[acyl-carrier-protein] synthase-3
MQSTLTHVRLAGLAVSVGSVVRDFQADGLAAGQDPAQLSRVAKAVGLRERRVAAAGVTALDLCADAAARLLDEAAIDASSLDAVIFVTQTPDHAQPNNASLLHARLGLSKAAAAYDLSLGCSGWVYGLHQAAMLCGAGAARVLVCAGDTLSRIVDPADPATAPIFGDAGSAALVEKTGDPAAMHFIFGTDGSGAGAIIVPAGGSRQPATAGSAACLRMDGAEVFNFSLREVPPAVAGALKLAGWTPADADHLVLHQANRFVISSVARKCGFPEEKTPMDLVERFGNQSSASIPAALAHACGESLQAGRRRLVVCGYGVGFSWGAAAFEAGPTIIAPTLPFPRS